jgi:hypothetical protein
LLQASSLRAVDDRARAGRDQRTIEHARRFLAADAQMGRGLGIRRRSVARPQS